MSERYPWKPESPQRDPAANREFPFQLFERLAKDSKITGKYENYWIHTATSELLTELHQYISEKAGIKSERSQSYPAWASAWDLRYCKECNLFEILIFLETSQSRLRPFREFNGELFSQVLHMILDHGICEGTSWQTQTGWDALTSFGELMEHFMYFGPIARPSPSEIEASSNELLDRLRHKGPMPKEPTSSSD